MRIKGIVKEQVVHILIDSGSTHNFQDLEFAKRLGCNITEIPHQADIVADGNDSCLQAILLENEQCRVLYRGNADIIRQL